MILGMTSLLIKLKKEIKKIKITKKKKKKIYNY